MKSVRVKWHQRGKIFQCEKTVKAAISKPTPGRSHAGSPLSPPTTPPTRKLREAAIPRLAESMAFWEPLSDIMALGMKVKKPSATPVPPMARPLAT
eukprot:g10536.t1